MIQQKNAGVSVARNKGIEEAKADLIAFLDADDEWKPNFLEEILGLKKNIQLQAHMLLHVIFICLMEK